MFHSVGNGKKLPNVFNKEQLKKLFEEIDDPQTMIGSLLGFFCGLRISEVTNLRVREIDFEKKRIRVTEGKGGKDGYVIVPPQLEEPLRMWIDLIGKNQEWMFPSQKRKGKPIVRSEIYRKYKKALARAGLRIEVGRVTYHAKCGNSYNQPKFLYYFHTLRHSYATYLYEQGIDIATVSKCMRHNQVDTTMIYTHISDSQRSEAINKAFDNRAMMNNLPVVDKIKENPQEILQRRFATGEITMNEFVTKIQAIKQVM